MSRSGFTLLEVMLALALSSLVVMLVAMAINLHLRAFDSGRTKVEEAQLARALLRRIADDLRSAVYYDPVDVEKLVPEAAMSGGDAAELAEEAGVDADALEELETDRTGNLAESTTLPPMPGLYGNRYELQVDTSRLPRIDQFDGMISATGDVSVVDRPSDVKTVTYYAITDQLDRTTYGSSDSQGLSGLVRRQWDRAATAWAAERGQLANLAQGTELIAPEVAAIEFLYYDGSEVVEEWDSVERGGLPMAVEIAIGIIPSRRRNMDAATLRNTVDLAATDKNDLLVYRMLVHLPVAEPTAGEGASEELPEEESSPEISEATNVGSGGTQPSGQGPER